VPSPRGLSSAVCRDHGVILSVPVYSVRRASAGGATRQRDARSLAQGPLPPTDRSRPVHIAFCQPQKQFARPITYLLRPPTDADLRSLHPLFIGPATDMGPDADSIARRPFLHPTKPSLNSIQVLISAQGHRTFPFPFDHDRRPPWTR